MSKGFFKITVGAILASATAMAQLHLTLAIVALVVGTCAAGATALAQIANPPGIDPPAGNPEPPICADNNQLHQ